MREEDEKYRDEDIVGAVNRFKRSLASGRMKYFDVAEFEGIVEQLLEEGDLKGAEIAAKQGMQIHPNAIPLQLKHAQVLISRGQIENALELLNTVGKIELNNPDLYLLRGSARMIMGDEKEALISFKKAIKFAGSEIDDVLYNIGSSYVQVGKINKALYYLEKAIKVNPKNDTVLYDLGFFYDQTGKYKKSVAYYNRYLDIDPFNYAVWFNLGTVYNKTDKHKKAIEAYEFALALKDDFYMAVFNIGNAYANSEKYEKAIEKYKEYVVVEPENDDAFCYIGECYLNLEQDEKAAYYYKKALDINKLNDVAWLGLGLIFWVNKSFEESIVHIKKAIKIDNENPEYWLTLGKVNADFNHKENAIKAFKRAARIDAGNTEIWLTWVDLFLKFGDLESARRIVRKGIKNNSDSVLKYRLVALLFESGKEGDALKMLKVAMEQEFEMINYLFDVYPKAMKNKKLKKVVNEFRSKDDLE